MILPENKPSRCILDGDILAYRAAYWADAEGIEYLEEKLSNDIQSWIPEGCTAPLIALSCSRKENFRRLLWSEYKAHRDDPAFKAPDCLPDAMAFIHTNYTVSQFSNIEADDIMGIGCSAYTDIAVTIDKDLRSVRGWHWNPTKEVEPILIDPKEANLNFHVQWISGDSTDNIPGIWKMGPVKSHKVLSEGSPENWTDIVLSLYETKKDRNNNPYTYEYAVTMARCVRILQTSEYDTKTNTPTLWTP